jgi:hypothetical protein
MVHAKTNTVGTPDVRPRLKPIIKSIAQSPPRFDPPRVGGTTRDRPGQRPAHTSSNKQHLGSRRKKAFNPFRQRDEDEVLAIRSHNRRRWSHVFPVGEIEFKRHAGPIWKSLTAPAILPLSVDYFPSPQELRDENTFQFSPYTVTLGGLDKKYYSTHAELLMEMVRQRLTQDFQLVTPAALKDSESRPDSQRQGMFFYFAFSWQWMLLSSLDFLLQYKVQRRPTLAETLGRQAAGRPDEAIFLRPSQR